MHSFNLVENNHCKKLTSTVIKEHEVYDMIFRRLSEKYKIPYISLLEFFCDSDFCRVEKEGMILYRDSNHLNIEGSRLVADFIVDTLERDRIEFD